MTKSFYAQTPEQLAAELSSDLEQGMTASAAAQRLQEEGPNQLRQGPPVSPWRILLHQFQDLMVFILGVAAAFGLLAWWIEGAHGLPADAMIIAAVLVLNAVLGFVQEFRAERLMQELQQVASASQVTTRRDGKVVQLDREQLVRGDVISLEEGDRIPADCLLIRSERLQVDESLLTGESLPVAKKVESVAADTPVDARVNSLFAGSTLTAGRARALVAGVGSDTELGRLAGALAQTESEETPLQRRLALLGKQIGWAVLAIALVVGGTILAMEKSLEPTVLTRVLMFSVALAVAAVPEGLPAVMTVSLSVGARRLAAQRAVVRKLAAVETLGSLTVIVTDKTGTLTYNQMTVSSLFYEGKELAVSGQGYEAEGKLEGEADALVRAAVLSSAGDLIEREGKRVPVGDPVDAALLVLAEKAGVAWQSLRKDSPEIHSEPFCSERARAVSTRTVDGQPRTYVKGSLETLLGLAASGTDAEGLRKAEQGYSSQALRVLAVAEVAGESEENLEILGLVAFGDPPRPEVRGAIEECRAAGIRVVMATGDHPSTAAAIGKDVGLKNDPVCTGPELEKLSDAEAKQMTLACDVFARVAPAAKLRLVESLLESGEVVAMTGDGVNDALALKKVHVGVSMGSGTAVAVEASQMVLLDDNFATIVKAVRGGRQVYRSLQQFIAFLFAGNFGVVLAMFLGTLFAGWYQLTGDDGLLLPLTAGQILWMNLAVDGAPAVAFSLAQDQTSVMNEPPRRPDSPILTGDMWKFVMVCGTFLAAGLLLVLDLLHGDGAFTVTERGAQGARSAGFYFVVCARLWNAFNFRTLPESAFTGRDLWVPAACLLSWGLTLALFLIAPLRNFFELVPLDLTTLAVLTVASSLVVVVGEVYKRLFKLRLS